MKLWAVIHIIFFLPLLTLAQDSYGPMPELKELAPKTPDAEGKNLNLQYENWYQRLGRDMSQEAKHEWSVKPHHNVTDQLKNNAINGGFNVNQELKRLDPTQIEGELIIRY